MAFKYKDRILKVGKSWTDDDGWSHPFNWASSWSENDLKKWGVTVLEDNDDNFDTRFYSSKDVEINLDDINVVDKDGKAVLDERTGKQQIIIGLKTKWIEITKSTANGLLTASDWYVTRKAETDTEIPSQIAKFRTDVRTATKTIEDSIIACKKLADFQKLFDQPTDKDGNPTGKAPIFDFPEEV